MKMRAPKDIPEVPLQEGRSLVESLELAATWHITRIKRRRLLIIFEISNSGTPAPMLSRKLFIL